MSEQTTAPDAAPSAQPAAEPTAVAAPSASDQLQLQQQALRSVCARCAGCIHMLPGGSLGCARLVRESEIVDANSRKSEEEKAAVREALFLPDRADQVKTFDKRACPVLKAWDQLPTEPDTAKILDNTNRFLVAAGGSPVASV